MAGNRPSDTSRAVDPGFVAAWVSHLGATHGSADAGGVRFYALDNEPELWSETHRDVHPQAQSYDELWERSLTYGQAVRAADPAARLLGFVSFGWSGYWYSQADLLATAANGYSSYPDVEAHGGRYQVEWYLAQMKAFEQAAGVRLLDYLDLHFYPQNGVALTDAGNAERQALRLRSTRALWDPTYRDESWIGVADQPAEWQAVRLIPRMREWVAAGYPGTGLAISEYNWGGLEHINGALAQADILGIFGREGVDLAALWNYPEEAVDYDRFGDLPGAYAFRMYRNYDGAGGKFGDLAVEATSSDEGRLAANTASRQADGALTLMVINKTDEPLVAALALSGFTPQATAQVYRYSEAALTAIRREADQPLGADGFSATFPARSITLVAGKAGG